MRRAAVEQASQSLDRARTSIQSMESATKLSEVEAAWSDFLTASHRLHSKLEQGAKDGNKSNNWWDGVKHQRKTDPVLQYTHQARHVDEHGLAAITDRDPASLALGVGPGTWMFDGKIGPGGVMKVTAMGGQVPGLSKFVELKAASVKLVKVTNRGVTYDPPMGADGKPLTPTEAANLAFDHLARIVEEAKKFPERD